LTDLSTLFNSRAMLDCALFRFVYLPLSSH
jgi:hypothetical protein